MHKTWDEKLSLIVRYIFIMPWCPANKLVWYIIIILSVHISGTANNTVSLSEVVTILKSNESSRMNLSAIFSILCIALFLLGNIFWARYKYRSLK